MRGRQTSPSFSGDHMVQILAVTAKANFRGLPDEGREGDVRPGDRLYVTKARAMALRANRLIEGDLPMPGDKNVNVPVFTTEESFQEETWSPEIAEERARMVHGDAPESPEPGAQRVVVNDPDAARPVTPAQGGVTAETMAGGDPAPKAEASRAAREREGTFDPATPVTPATGGGDAPALKTEGVTEASFERYATPKDATNREVTRGEVAAPEEKPKRGPGRPPRNAPKPEQPKAEEPGAEEPRQAQVETEKE
jgi:hypothetical protein